MGTAVRATYRHNRETWTAALGEPLTGMDGDGGPLALTEVVLQIEPEASAIRVIGWLPDWDPVHELRVGELRDVDWVDEEIELVVARTREVPDLIASRARQGWTVRDQLALPRRPQDHILVFVRVRTPEQDG